MRFLIEKILGAVVHVPFLPYAINLERWGQMEAPKWRYFRVYDKSTVSVVTREYGRVEYPRFRWTPFLRRVRRVD